MITAKEYLKEKGINPKEPIFWYSGVDYMTIEQVIKDYAKQYASVKVKEALKLAAEAALPEFYDGNIIGIDAKSILSLETELIELINKEK